MVLHDNETAIDLLYYESIASTIKNVTDQARGEPLTIGIHGDWGAGKSSILAMIEGAYKDDADVLCIRFNGWLFQGFEDAKLVLLEKVITEIQDAAPVTAKIKKKLKKKAKSLLRRIDWMKGVKTLGHTGFSLVAGMPTPELAKTAYDAALSMVDGPSADKIPALIKPLKAFIKKSDKNKEQKTVPKEIHAFREEFEDYLAEADIKQLVVLIDDLDRCLPSTTIETLEAIRLFLFTPQTAFIVAADEAMIEYAVKQHFPDLPNTLGAVSYARNYLEKLIQVPFRIPALGSIETLTYVALLLAMRGLGVESKGFKELKALSKKAIQKPWLGNTLKQDAIDEVIKDEEEKKIALQALTLSQQIAPLLAEGTDGNPRQIKRFINSLMLRKQIAEARGFGDDIEINILAKLMLAENFSKEFYKNINEWVNNSTNGVVGEFADLESEKDSVETDVWQLNWVRINPTLVDIDLRPYLFITRDRKTSYGVISQLGDLENLADNLLGSSMVVAGLEGKVKELSTQDAKKILEHIGVHISQQIIVKKKEPEGWSGLLMLTKYHSDLQSHLCTFLSTIDDKKIGSWAVKPIDVFTNLDAKKLYLELLGQWHDQKENKTLSTYAGRVLSPKGKK